MDTHGHSQSDLRLISFPATTRRSNSVAFDLATPIPTTAEPRASAAPAEPVAPVTPRERIELASRVLNVTIAGTALVALSPIMLVTAVLVKATSRGPIFYRQTRVGVDRRRPKDDLAFQDRRLRDLGGRVFTIYKFRSMTVDAERNSGAVWATKSDPRVTPLGRILRKTRVDELPQLFNVLRGDMNIVGPRPERPGIFANLRRDIADYPLRQLAKPGITGWAQINHNYDTSLEDVRTKVRFDLEYLQRQSLTEDLKIMLRTVPVMIFRRGGW